MDKQILTPNNQSGQSTIEFLMSFIFAIGFLLIAIKTAFNITNGFIYHYATFMASRAYYVQDNNSNNPQGTDGRAEQIANEVLQSFRLEQALPSISPTVTFLDPEGSQVKAHVGMRVEFTQKMTLGSLIGGDQEVNFVSESYLLRSPVVSECLERVCAALTESGSGGNCSTHTTVADNGC